MHFSSIGSENKKGKQSKTRHGDYNFKKSSCNEKLKKNNAKK